MLLRLGMLFIVITLLGLMAWGLLACDRPMKGQPSNQDQEKNKPSVDLDRAIFPQPSDQSQEKKPKGSSIDEAHGNEFEGIWNREVYEVHTISSANGPIASWIMFTINGDYEASFETAKDLMEHYHKQPEERKEAGIFIYSHTYAVPDTPEERRYMTQYLWELYKNPEWRKSETALIENLRVECEKQKLPLYVNLSGNLQGKWKKLAPLNKLSTSLKN